MEDLQNMSGNYGASHYSSCKFDVKEYYELAKKLSELLRSVDIHSLII